MGRAPAAALGAPLPAPPAAALGAPLPAPPAAARVAQPPPAAPPTAPLAAAAPPATPPQPAPGPSSGGAPGGVQFYPPSLSGLMPLPVLDVEEQPSGTPPASTPSSTSRWVK